MSRTRVIPALLAAGLALVSGCTWMPPQDQRVSELESENAALRAQLLALQTQGQPGPAPQPAEPRQALDPATRAKLESLGVKVRDTGDSVLLTLPNNVLFASGSASLRSSSKRALDESASIIKSHLAGARVVVQGHTDSIPIKRSKARWKSNQELSVDRARAVASYLQSAGIAADLVSVEGFGSSRPVATNKTSQGRALNRRVELLIKVAP